MKLKLNKNKYTLIDKEDFDKVSQFNWFFNGKHAYRTVQKNYKSKTIYLHRFITNCPKGKTVDHINGDGLDNRKENFRICSQKNNSYNAKICKRNKSGFKGVSWIKSRKKWYVSIEKNGYSMSLGLFLDKEEAALAYNKYAKKYFGQYARLNNI